VKGRLVVSFVNEQGMLEAGLDYGGLVKEFLEQVPAQQCSPCCLSSLDAGGKGYAMLLLSSIALNSSYGRFCSLLPLKALSTFMSSLLRKNFLFQVCFELHHPYVLTCVCQ